MRRRPLAVANTATDTGTTRTFETRIIGHCNNSKLSLKLLQTENTGTETTFHSTQSLTTLNFSTEMTRLNSRMT